MHSRLMTALVVGLLPLGAAGAKAVEEPMMPDNDGDVPQVKLVRHIDVSSYGSEIMASGDVNGDGRIEFVFMQGPGMLAADMFKPGAGSAYGNRYTTEADQALDCLTAIDSTGSVLWQQGEPWQRPIPFRQHGGFMMLLVEDVDADDRAELVRIRGNALQILDGAAGRMVNEAKLDNDGYSSILTARFGRGNGRHIVVKPCSNGLEGHPYGCPVVAFDHKLNQVWSRQDHVHVGHTPVAYDVNGDGIDELLIGSHCLNADASVRWTLPLEKTHDDRRMIADINEDGRPEQVLAFEAEGLVVSDLEGRILWKREADHCGEAKAGKFYADRPGLQVFGNNENWRVSGDVSPVASYMLDSRGKVIWESPHDRYVLVVDWPTSLGPQALLAKPHLPDPPDARPFIMDGAGRKIAEFDIPKRLPSAKEFDLPHDGVKWGDWGDYYAWRYMDMGDDEWRILIWSRTDLWIFDVAPDV